MCRQSQICEISRCSRNGNTCAVNRLHRNDVLPAVHDTYTDDEKSRTHRKCLPKAVRILWICVPHSKCLCKRHTALLQNRPSLDNDRCIYGLYGNMQVARNNPCRQEPVYGRKVQRFLRHNLLNKRFWLTQPDTIEIWNNKITPKEYQRRDY